MYVCMYVCMYIYIYTHLCTYVCIYIFIYIYICVCTSTVIHLQTLHCAARARGKGCGFSNLDSFGAGRGQADAEWRCCSYGSDWFSTRVFAKHKIRDEINLCNPTADSKFEGFPASRFHSSFWAWRKTMHRSQTQRLKPNSRCWEQYHSVFREMRISF